MEAAAVILVVVIFGLMAYWWMQENLEHHKPYTHKEMMDALHQAVTQCQTRRVK